MFFSLVLERLDETMETRKANIAIMLQQKFFSRFSFVNLFDLVEVDLDNDQFYFDLVDFLDL